jgi:hypothetical protein
MMLKSLELSRLSSSQCKKNRDSKHQNPDDRKSSWPVVFDLLKINDEKDKEIESLKAEKKQLEIENALLMEALRKRKSLCAKEKVKDGHDISTDLKEVSLEDHSATPPNSSATPPDSSSPKSHSKFRLPDFLRSKTSPRSSPEPSPKGSPKSNLATSHSTEAEKPTLSRVSTPPIFRKSSTSEGIGKKKWF